MTSIQSPTPADDADPRRSSTHIFYPLATIKCAGTPAFRTQAARDFACLLDLDPDVLEWSCDGVGLSFGNDGYMTDFLVTSVEGRSVYVDVAHGPPSPPDWIELAAERTGHGYRPVAMQDFHDNFRLANARDLLRYGFYRCPLGDRIRILAALDEMGSLTMTEALSAFREGRPMGCLASLVLQGFLEIELDDALIGPDTVVRRIRD